MNSLLVSGGKIWTGDLDSPFIEAFLVNDDHFVACGSLEEILTNPESEKALKLDLEGRAVIPGMTDSHLHLGGAVSQEKGIDLGDVSSLSEMLDLIKKKAKLVPEDSWILAYNFNETSWPEARMPCRKDLDSLNIPNPILLRRTCIHYYIANSKAIDLGDSVKQPGMEGNSLSPFNTSGIFREAEAQDILEAYQRSIADTRMEDQIYFGLKMLARAGFTSIHTCDASSYGMSEDMTSYMELKHNNRLPVRITSYHDMFPINSIVSGSGDLWIRYGGMKIFLDGCLGGRSASLSFPYADDIKTCGQLNFTSEHLHETLKKCAGNGIQVLIHCIGDKALDQILEEIEKILFSMNREHLMPYRLNHVSICRSDQIERMSNLPVVCDVQPKMIDTDMGMIASRVGLENISNWQRIKSLIERGIQLNASSDFPIESYDPWPAIQIAVTGNALDGRGYTQREESISLPNALSMFTTNPPKAIGLGKILGKIKAGFKADFTVLDSDPFIMDPGQLFKIHSDLTFVNGKLSWGKLNDWAMI